MSKTNELTFRELVSTIENAHRVFVTVTTLNEPFHALADKDDLIFWAKVGTVDIDTGYRSLKSDAASYDAPCGLCATVVTYPPQPTPCKAAGTSVYLHPAH